MNGWQMCVESGFCQILLGLSILVVHSKLLVCLLMMESYHKKNLTVGRACHSNPQPEKLVLAGYLNEEQYSVLQCWCDALSLNNYWVSCMRISCENYHHILKNKQEVRPMSIRLLGRWVSRHPVDSHFLLKIVIIFFYMKLSL